MPSEESLFDVEDLIFDLSFEADEDSFDDLVIHNSYFDEPSFISEPFLS